MKTSLLTIVALSTLLTTAMPKSNEEQQVETRYGFNETSHYATLLSALQRSFADYLANPADKGAIGANLLVFKYASAEERIRLHADFGLAQADPAIRQKASQDIGEYLKQGGSLTQPLKQQVSDKLWNQLKSAAGQDRRVREFIANATDALLLLGDSRGLDAALANKAEVENLKAADGWSASTDAATLRQLEQRYRAPANGGEADIRRAEVYRLLAARKDASVAFEPSSEVQNLTQILK